MPPITDQEFDALSRYVYEMTGIVLPPDKAYLLESRMQPLMNAGGFANYHELHRAARADRSSELPRQIVDAITTNETFFFRDRKPFELLRHKIVPDLIDRRRRAGAVGRLPLRIWSAACSTGQEVYSIAMTLAELLPVRGYDIQIVGTDISSRALAAASYGQYNAFDVQRGLPEEMRRKYFLPGAAGTMRVRDELRAMVRFESINLLKPLGHLPSFDVIFCRNVAIYFSREDKVRLFANLARVLQADGALILGGSETLTGMESDFVSRSYLQGLYFQLRSSDGPAVQPAPAVEAPLRPMVVPPPLGKEPARPRSAPSSLSPSSSSPAAAPPLDREGPGKAGEQEGVMAATGSLLEGLAGGGARPAGASLLSVLHKRAGTGGAKDGQPLPAGIQPGSLLARLQQGSQPDPPAQEGRSEEEGAEEA